MHMGLEKVNLRRLSSIAKILGTTSCVGGTISMALLKGPALVNGQLPPSNSLVVQSLGGDTWFLGCLCLVGAMCCWSLWIILQVPITERCSDHISLSAWMCFLAMLQAGVVAPFFERDPQAWKLSSSLELICCFFPGVFGSGIQFVVLPWCVSRRGPVFSAMFSPLCTVITTVLACIFLHEKIYLGSLLGAMAVIIGLYVVLWGKSEELKAKVFEPDSPVQNIVAEAVQEKTDCEDDLEQQLLMTDHSTNQQ